MHSGICSGHPTTDVRAPHICFCHTGIQHANATLDAMAEAGRRCELYVVHGERSHAGRLYGYKAASAGRLPCHWLLGDFHC